MYAIIQVIEDFKTVCGGSHVLYDDLERAKIAYTEIAMAFYDEYLKKTYKPLSVSIPKLIDLKTDEIIYPKNDLNNEIIELYNAYQIESRANDDAQYNKAKALKEKYISDLKSKLIP